MIVLVVPAMNLACGTEDRNHEAHDHQYFGVPDLRRGVALLDRLLAATIAATASIALGARLVLHFVLVSISFITIRLAVRWQMAIGVHIHRVFKDTMFQGA